MESQFHSRKEEKCIFISAGEISGDYYSGEVIRRLRTRKDLKILALGGTQASEAGALLVYDTIAISTVGFWELLSTLNRWKTAWNLSKRTLKNFRPRVVILIDNPGFNLRLAKLCYRMGIPVVYFVPPQVWVWKKNRANLLSRYADWILTIFPWEKEYFPVGKAQVRWVGHPVLSKIPKTRSGDVSEKSPHVVLLPGSRKKEIVTFLKVIKKALVSFTLEHPQIRFSLVSASEQNNPIIQEKLAGLPIRIEKRENLYRILQQSSLCISCSGTITLEVALMGVPQIIVYRLSYLTYFLARLFLKKRYIGLPNILMKREVCPELIQGNFNSSKIIQTMEKLLSDNRMVESMQCVAGHLRNKLTHGETYSQIIEVIENYL